MTPANRFLTALQSPRPLLSDGAMGTMLHQRGITFEDCFDRLNLTQPAVVAEVHREYIEAGSNIIQTNTFGANRFKLARHGLEDKVAEINRAGVELARRVALASFKDVLIAGDVGPLGVRLAPFGRVQPEEARAAFAEQIAVLAESGVDLLIIETMTDLYEVVEAIQAARETAPQLPVVASMTFTRDDRTLLGDSPAKVARGIHAAGADLIGVNCSGGPHQILRILKQMRQAVPEATFSVMPNAGWPEQVGGRIMYAAAPEYFGEYALAFWEAGARLIGGCCGTTPQHIQFMAQAIQSADPAGIQPQEPAVVAHKEETAPAEQPTQLAQKLAAGRFVVAVEMDPPRGLSTHKLVAGASLLAEAGADVINVADSPMARMRMSPWAVCSLLQRRVNVETVLHFPTRGRNLLRVQGDLLAAHALDVRNVFVVMGDPTAIGDYPNANDNYDLVPSGLIKLIKQGFNAGLDHSGADIGQPTSFFVGCALNLAPADPESEIKNLRRKLKAGADFVLTQPTYNPAEARSFLQKVEADLGQPLPIPLLAGILPLASNRHANFLHQEVPGIIIPDEIRARMDKAGDKGARQGIQIAIELIKELRDFAQGVYIMPAFNHFDYAAEIIEAIRSVE
ncbi:MAG: bifunctional homocysteine S-methyltransferase/methylenetetrahydrofolate reductase [Anaerolineaceae bacterium]|nr:bifunctional homocysteine S-methyltransferase/methylenetetrahydrofolate reductase [Anaerolineaceae bacterium]